MILLAASTPGNTVIAGLRARTREFASSHHSETTCFSALGTPDVATPAVLLLFPLLVEFATAVKSRFPDDRESLLAQYLEAERHCTQNPTDRDQHARLLQYLRSCIAHYYAQSTNAIIQHHAASVTTWGDSEAWRRTARRAGIGVGVFALLCALSLSSQSWPSQTEPSAQAYSWLFALTMFLSFRAFIFNYQAKTSKHVELERRLAAEEARWRPAIGQDIRVTDTPLAKSLRLVREREWALLVATPICFVLCIVWGIRLLPSFRLAHQKSAVSVISDARGVFTPRLPSEVSERLNQALLRHPGYKLPDIGDWGIKSLYADSEVSQRLKRLVKNKAFQSSYVAWDDVDGDGVLDFFFLLVERKQGKGIKKVKVLTLLGRGDRDPSPGCTGYANRGDIGLVYFDNLKRLAVGDLSPRDIMSLQWNGYSFSCSAFK